MPTRSYYVVAPAAPRTWLGRWLRRRRGGDPLAVSDGRDYTGWTARATTGRDVPVGTVGPVLAARQRGGDLVHVIGFPALTLHVPLPWPGIELIEPA